MSVIYSDIRQALEVTLNDNVSVDIAWENTDYTPTTANSFVRPVFIPTIREPAVRGLNPQQLHRGIFTVDCFTPINLGPSAGDILANTVITVFEATTDLTANGKTISIRSAERRMAMEMDGHYMTPVIINWYIYD